MTDDDLNVAEGHVAAGDSEHLLGKLQARYGWNRGKAQQELRDFGRKL